MVTVSFSYRYKNSNVSMTEFGYNCQIKSDIATLLQFDREQEVSAENFIALSQEANEILCHTTWLQTKNKTKKGVILSSDLQVLCHWISQQIVK